MFPALQAYVFRNVLGNMEFERFAMSSPCDDILSNNSIALEIILKTEKVNSNLIGNRL